MADMAENGSHELTVKQETFIAALIAGHNIQVSAKAARIGERTAYRWLKLPHIQAAYKDAQKQAFDDSLNELRLGVKEALETLRKHMSASVEPTAATQLRAGQIWLEQAISIHKMTELEQKVADLEQLLKTQGMKA